MSILCIGSAVIDISASGVPEPEAWREKQRIGGIRMLPGGDALNQAVVLRKLQVWMADCPEEAASVLASSGGDAEMKTMRAVIGKEAETVQLVSAIGPDANGALHNTMLAEKDVGTGFLAVYPETVTGTSLVLVNPSGERHTFSTGGAYGRLSLADLPPLDEVIAISLASLFQMPELEKNGLKEYLCEANGREIPVFADLGSDKMKQGIGGIRHLLPHIDWFLPSASDAIQMTEQPDGGTENADAFRSRVEAAARFFAARGSRNVVIKCGKDGCYYRTLEEAGWVPALPVTPVDTSGAGDCMAAVFLTQILQGKPVREACETACRLASWSTLFPGANGVIFEGIGWNERRPSEPTGERP